MTPAEKIAADTWERLKLSRDLRVRLGEETLTDLLALDFVRFMPNQFKLISKYNKCEESERGADLGGKDSRRRHQASHIGSTSQEAVSIKPVRPHQIGG